MYIMWLQLEHKLEIHSYLMVTTYVHGSCNPRHIKSLLPGWYLYPEVRRSWLGLAVFSVRSLFISYVSEGSSHTEVISLICCTFPENLVCISLCLRRSTCVPLEEWPKHRLLMFSDVISIFWSRWFIQQNLDCDGNQCQRVIGSEGGRWQMGMWKLRREGIWQLQALDYLKKCRLNTCCKFLQCPGMQHYSS